MAIVYRSEKKKIIASQISLLKQVISILERLESVITPGDEESSRQPYQKLLLEETDDEAERRTQIECSTKLTEEKRTKELLALEESFYYRRIINATYYK